jgi:hypothetical protein
VGTFSNDSYHARLVVDGDIDSFLIAAGNPRCREMRPERSTNGSAQRNTPLMIEKQQNIITAYSSSGSRGIRTAWPLKSAGWFSLRMAGSVELTTILKDVIIITGKGARCAIKQGQTWRSRKKALKNGGERG